MSESNDVLDALRAEIREVRTIYKRELELGVKREAMLSDQRKLIARYEEQLRAFGYLTSILVPKEEDDDEEDEDDY